MSSDVLAAGGQGQERERLRRLRVTGFRSLRALDLELGDLTVLVGANGSGKSNFVGIFKLLGFTMSGSLQLYVGRKGGATSILHYGPKVTPILSTELRFEGRRGWSEYRCTLAFASPDKLIFTREDLAFLREGESKPFDRLLGAGHSETELLELVNSKNAALSTTARVFLERLGGLQVYHFHDTSEQAYIRTLQDIDRNRYLLSDAGNLAAFLHMLKARHAAHYARILATIRLVVPFLEDFTLEPDRLNAGRIQLRWRDRDPDYEFGPHQLSDGSLRAIALVTALLQPEELLPSLLVFDEPELGLHPSAISLVGQLIKAVSSKCQVIVATQSPRLLSEFAPEDVVVVEREEDGSGQGWSTFRRLEEQELGQWLEEYDLGTLYEMNVTGGGPG